MKSDSKKTLEQLEQERWSDADLPSRLAAECCRLRKVPLRQLTAENLRILLGQDIGSRHLVPIALQHLEADPFVEGAFYPGDLLCSVLSLPRSFWASQPALRDRAASLAARANAALAASDYAHGPVAAKAVREAFNMFAANGDSPT